MRIRCSLTEKDSMSASALTVKHLTPGCTESWKVNAAERQAGATHHFSELITAQIQALQLCELMHAPANTHIVLTLLPID